MNCFWKIYPKEGTNKDIIKEKMFLYIVTGAPTLFYQERNHNSCILSSLGFTLHYIGYEYASEYMIRRKKTLFWKFRINIRCTYAVIFLWDITKQTKKAQLSYWGIVYIQAIWYISESIYLSNCVFDTIHMAPQWSLYYSLWYMDIWFQFWRGVSTHTGLLKLYMSW